jgi:hypothetical protein
MPCMVVQIYQLLEKPATAIFYIEATKQQVFLHCWYIHSTLHNMVIYTVKNIYLQDIAVKKDGPLKAYHIFTTVRTMHICKTLCSWHPHKVANWTVQFFFNLYNGVRDRDTLIFTIIKATREYEHKHGRDPKGSLLAPVVTAMERKRRSNYLQQMAHQDCTVNTRDTTIIHFRINGRCSVIIHVLYAQTCALC